jgi:hypothetical protein
MYHMANLRRGITPWVELQCLKSHYNGVEYVHVVFVGNVAISTKPLEYFLV